MYVLQRHLLKYEAIYPPETDAIGFIRSEGVFPRESVRTLQGRENWFHLAKTVIVDEEPYKRVKARPKWDRITGSTLPAGILELFGDWQIEDFIPPTAKNGKVPRNEYGNVDLFQPCMLPKKCSHLKVPGLLRIARKLGFDCVPATVGFDFSSHGSHPIHDGFIVCEEFKDTLLDAWHEDQIIQAEKEKEKRYQRIYGNWKRLIKGFLLRERMKERYGATLEEEQIKLKELKEKQVKLKEALPKKVQKKIINQKDLSAAVPVSINHRVVNLKIDLSTVAERNIKSKRKAMAAHKKSISKSSKIEVTDSSRRNTTTGLPDSLSSSDSDDQLNEHEKKEKIRQILSWNPDQFIQRNKSISSDDSATDNNIGCSSATVGKRSKSKIFSKTKKMKKSSDKDKLVLSQEDDQGEKKFVRQNRLSLRRTTGRNLVSYKEEFENEFDISFSESDTCDKSYDPKKEIAKTERGIDLSEESA